MPESITEPPHINLPHSHVCNNPGPISNKFEFHINPTQHNKNHDSLLLQVDTNVQDFSRKSNLGRIDASSPKFSHLPYPYLFHKSSTPMMSPYSLNIYPVEPDCNQVHNYGISKLKDEIIKSLVHDHFNLHSWRNGVEDSTSLKIRDGSLAYSSSSSILKESHV